MSQSFTISTASTFTVSHARYLSSKVAADLKRLQRFYGSPSDAKIAQFESELTEYLRYGYLSEVIYGFKRNNMWISPTLRYTANEIASGIEDNDPGRIPANADTSGGHFSSFLTYSSKWHSLNSDEQERFEETLPFQRTSGISSSVEGGYFATDNTYSSGGRSLGRAIVRSY